MSKLKYFNPIAALIGSFTGVACSLVLDTAFFNLYVWYAVGSVNSQEAAILVSNNNPFFQPIGALINISSFILAGIIAAKFENSRPYLSAVIAGLLIMLYFLVFITGPVKQSHMDALTFIGAFILPLPSTIFGAYLFKRVGKSN